jgi:hypothetical protein
MKDSINQREDLNSIVMRDKTQAMNPSIARTSNISE